MSLLTGGKVIFTAIGAYCEQFIDELMHDRIKIGNIRNEKGMIYAEADRADYLRIAKISRKYGVRVRVYRRKGAYFKLRRLKKRPGLLIGAFVSVCMVLTLRLFVWHIDIHGNSEITDDQMLLMLEGYGFTAGAVANDTDALNAERNIMMSTDNISWINIEVNGSRADVYMHERGVPDIADSDISTPCNIVASRTGVIADTSVNSGKLMYEKGSGVAKGSVIVSGVVSSGNTVILVHSDAKIIAEFTEKPEFSMKYTTYEKVPEGETFTHKQLMLLGMVFSKDALPDTSDTLCAESTEELSLFGIKLPVKIKTDVFTKYREVPVTRKRADVERILESRLEMYKFNFLKDYEILDVQKELVDDGDGMTLKAEIKLRGEIGVKQSIYDHSGIS